MPHPLASRANLKDRLRRDRLAARDALAEAARQAAARSIAERGAMLIAPRPGSIIAGYWPIRSELDPRPLMETLRARGALIALPVVTGRGLLFRLHAPDEPMQPAGFGTLGPPASARSVVPGIVLAPLAAFDEAGRRIGYGGGYYDRTLAALAAAGHRPRLIGLAYEMQKVDEVPHEGHDFRLDIILTERRMLRVT